MLRKCRIEVEGREPFASPPGPLLVEALDAAGVETGGVCGNMGKCGGCRVRFLGPPPEPSPAEARLLGAETVRSGVRLACRHQVEGDVRLEVILAGPRELLDELL